MKKLYMKIRKGGIVPDSLAGIVILVALLVILIVAGWILKDKIINAVKYAASLLRYR
jgi:hypothetical protein